MSDTSPEVAQVMAFFATWAISFDGMLDGFKAIMAEDCLLTQTRTPDLAGLPAIAAFLNTVRSAQIFETIEVECRKIFVSGNFVMSERIDRLRDVNKTTIATAPCVGIMEFRSGKLVEWHDYFDSADMPTGAMSFIATSSG